MTIAFLDSTAAYLDEPCEVEINKNRIVVSYYDENEVVLYIGESIGSGHFQLVCPAKNGKASLHMFEGGHILDGYWIESDYEGFWRIKLA